MLVLLGAFLTGYTPSASASEQLERTFAPVPGVITAPPPGTTLHNDAFRRIPKQRLRATASAAEYPYTTPDGMVVFIAVSDGYVRDPSADQVLANFLASLLHGSELNGLRVFVATPSELPSLCGGDAAACYDLLENRMYVVGASSFGDIPTDYAIAHEYGHHVSGHRKNSPFPGGAFAWGTKRWASLNLVCPRIAQGKLTFDPSGFGYYFLPAENFAETFAYLHYPGRVPWEFAPFLYPTARDYRRIRQDVARPWTRNGLFSSRGRVTANGDWVDTFTLGTPLDGSLRLRLLGPRRSDLDLFLLYRGRVVKRSIGRSANERLRFLVCGEAGFSVKIAAYRGGGRFRVVASRP